MNIGEAKCEKLESGLKRTGTVVYIHPESIYYVLKFQCAFGAYRESFLMSRGEIETEKRSDKAPPGFTPEQDKQILRAKDMRKLAKKIGKSVDCLYQRRRRLKMKGEKAK